MEVLGWVISLVSVALLGYHYREVVERVNELTAKAVTRKTPPDKKQGGVVIDPLDVVQMARLEHERRMRELNPELYEDEL